HKLQSCHGRSRKPLHRALGSLAEERYAGEKEDEEEADVCNENRRKEIEHLQVIAPIQSCGLDLQRQRRRQQRADLRWSRRLQENGRARHYCLPHHSERAAGLAWIRAFDDYFYGTLVVVRERRGEIGAEDD